MPYQDIDDEAATPVSRDPTSVERWTRKILLEDWGLKLLAAVVTISLWMAVTGQNQPVRQRTAVQLHFIRPEGIEISNDVPGSVEVMLKGSQSRLNNVGPTLVATIDLTNQKAGERVVRLQEKAQLTLPPDVSIEGFRPASFALRLELIMETVADVEVKFDGKLPDGYEVMSVTTTPSRVKLRGPADRVSSLQKVVTESVSLNDRTESFDLTNVALIVGDPKVEAIDSNIVLHVEIAEKKSAVADPVSRRAASSLDCPWFAFFAFERNTHPEMTRLFGTDGIRGEAGKFPLDASTVETIGASLVTHLTREVGRTPLIVIGRDTRESGEWLEEALLSGISIAGGQSKSAGIITTPGVAYLARTLPADAGIVISASHNPYRDNGIKVFSPSGRKLDEATERLIEADVASEKEKLRRSDSIKSESTPGGDATALTNRYQEYLQNEIGRGLSLEGMRLVIDCANGAASAIAPQLLSRLGASVVSINAEPDGRNINLASGSLHTERLQNAVLKQKADLGVAVDGDADRSLFVDATGQLVNGDAALWVLANYMQARKQLVKSVVVATVMSNIGLEIALNSRGIELVRTDVGDKFVLDELLRLGASLGGEQSGHIIFPQLSLAGDGLITTLCLIRAMVEQGKSLAELTAGFQTFPQILVNVEVKQKLPFDEIPAIKDSATKIENELGAKGRLLLRYSGTEPLARVMIEGEHQQQIDRLANELADEIKKHLG